MAVLRANAIGDYVYAIPALESLRAAYPLAEIVLLGRSWHARFLKDRPGPVDRVMVTPLSRGVNDPSPMEIPHWEEDQDELERFFKHARAERFDLAIQLHGGGRYSNPFLLNLGARFTAGMRTPDAPLLDRWIPYQYWQNEILRLLECVALVGADPVSVRPKIAITAADRAEAESILPPIYRMAVIHAGATDPRRRWAVENFAQIGDWLADAGFSVVLIGAPFEQAINESIARHMRAPVIDLVGRVSLNGLVGLLEQACLLVGNDSGPLHLAEAVGTPSVGIYWAGNMVNFGPPSVARHRQLLSWQMDCPVCGKSTIIEPCEHRESFVNFVTVEQVIDVIQGLLEYAQPLRV